MPLIFTIWWISVQSSFILLLHCNLKSFVQIGIYGSGTTSSSAKIVKKILSDNDIHSFTITPKSKTKQCDCVIVLGGDKGIRNYFHRTFDSSSPVLGISEGESGGFLAQIDLKEFSN